MKKLACLASLLVVGLVACSGQAPTVIPSPVIPTLTPHSTLTPISASTPTIWPTSASRCWKKEKECEIAKKLGVKNIDLIFSFSPDMQWAAIDKSRLGSDMLLIAGLRVAKADGTQEWTFDATQFRKALIQCSGQFTTDFWSADSRYVYFSYDPGWCSRNVNFSSGNTPILYRLDVKTGIFLEYLPGAGHSGKTSLPTGGYYTFKFSPDGLYLAYLQTFNSPVVVTVRNLKTESEMVFKLDKKYPEAGCLAWMDDSQHLLFYGATTTSPNHPTSTSLYLVDINQKTIREIYNEQPNVYCAIDDRSWLITPPNPKDFLLVEKMALSYWTGERFYLNPLTKQTLPWPTPASWASSTPRPTGTPLP